jgi:hypothetical protein
MVESIRGQSSSLEVTKLLNADVDPFWETLCFGADRNENVRGDLLILMKQKIKSKRQKEL